MVSFQEGKSIWYGPEVVHRESEWIFGLTEAELEELAAAADILVKASPGLDQGFISLELLDDLDKNFTLPLIRSKATEFVGKIHDGLGFVVWRGVPVAEWPYPRVCAAFLIIGKCMGNLRQQNAKGHVLGHVKDLGLASTDPNVRVYQTSERQTFHCDSCDVVGLLCLKVARSGGLSSLVSSGTIFNELLRRHPDVAQELLRPFPVDKRGEVVAGTAPFFNIPVYNYYEGHLSVKYQRQYIDSAQRFPEAPRLTQSQVEALDLFDSFADDPKLHFTMKLEPGDMQFVHNHSMLHDRTAFEDEADPAKRRHLLRIWIAPTNSRPLPEVFAAKFGSVTVGDRGGVTIPGVTPVAPMHA